MIKFFQITKKHSIKLISNFLLISNISLTNVSEILCTFFHGSCQGKMAQAFAGWKKRATKLWLLTADLGSRNRPSPKINNLQLKEQPV